MARFESIAGIVLAGGRSSRMGRDKAQLIYEGRTLLQRSIDFLREHFAETIVAGGDPARYPDLDVPCAPDRLSGQGALIGIHAGLCATRRPRIFVMACDAPFPQLALIERLLTMAPEADWIVPRTDRGLEPLFAVYSQRCRPAIESLFAANELRVRLLAKQVATVYLEEAELRLLDPQLRSFINLNTPGEWSELQASLPDAAP